MGPLALTLPIGPRTEIGAPPPLPQERADPSVRVVVTERRVLAHWGDPCALAAADRFEPDAILAQPPVLIGRSLVVHDRIAGTTLLCPDRFGLFPLLLHLDADAGSVHVTGRAAEMAALLGDRARLDPEAALELLAFGQLIGERSPLDGVRHLTAARPVCVQADGRTIAVPAVDCAPGAGDRRFSEATAIEALVAAVDRRCRHADGAVLPVSGGLDSRLLLAAARAAGHRPDMVCFGIKASADRTIAQALAQAAGGRLMTGTLSRPAFEQASGRIAQAGCAEVPLNHGQSLVPESLNDACRGRILVTGTGGEIYRAFYYDRGMPGMSVLGVAALRGRLLPRAARYACETLDRTFLPFARAFPFLAGSLAARRDAAFAAVAEGAQDAASFLDGLYRELRMRRFVVAGQGLLDGLFHRSHPFLDAEVAGAWAGMPAGLRLGSRFHRRAIVRLAPELAAIPWDRTLRPLAEGMLWSERFPGLAARLGRPATYAKHGTGLADYDSWLNDPDGSRIVDYMAACGFDRDDLQAGITALLGGPAATHARGVLGAVSLWLGQRRAVVS